MQNIIKLEMMEMASGKMPAISINPEPMVVMYPLNQRLPTISKNR